MAISQEVLGLSRGVRISLLENKKDGYTARLLYP